MLARAALCAHEILKFKIKGRKWHGENVCLSGNCLGSTQRTARIMETELVKMDPQLLLSAFERLLGLKEVTVKSKARSCILHMNLVFLAQARVKKTPLIMRILRDRVNFYCKSLYSDLL